MSLLKGRILISMPLLWKGKERILGQARRKAKGTKEVKVRPTRIQMQKAKVWDHIGSKTKFSGTLVKLVVLAVTASKNLSMMPKRTGNKGSKGTKSGKENDWKRQMLR